MSTPEDEQAEAEFELWLEQQINNWRFLKGAKPTSSPHTTKSFITTWRISANKPTEFGYYYRWYVPKFIYSWIMQDLQFIKRNRKLIYKKAGYKPKDQIGGG